MVEVTLHDYCTEIEDLIDQGSYDAAISHCQHILKVYPKYVRVYGLMGKTVLERGDLEAAADLFSRLLSMDPEDFVARVGMSIASDREGSLDQAVWHMERAFELAPDNQAIVAELRRLYGRRDGVEPEKVPLTQSALARLHARGSLHTQAINEFRRLLAAEPERVDLQVALAETLWRADRRIEAAETSLALLERLPYCLKANLILGEIWISGGREQEGSAHLERARMMDPENRVAQALFGERSPLSPVEVRIGRMEYVAPPAAEEREPDWLQTLIEEGTGVAEADEAIPGWLQAVATAAEVGEEQSPEEAPAEPEAIPDWLQDVTAMADAEAEEFSATPEMAVPEPDESHMPDWLAQLTAEQAEEEAETIDMDAEGVALEPEEEAAPAESEDWLADLEVGAEIDAVGEELPPWLADMQADEAEGVEGELPMAEEAEGSASDIPEWMAAEDAGPQDIEETPDELPEWLAAIAPTETDLADLEEADLSSDSLAEMEEIPGAGAQPERMEAGGDELPDWLTDFAPEEAAVEELEAGELPDWLMDMAPTEEAAAEVADMDLAPAEIPGWLAEMAPPEAAATDVEDLGVSEAEIPDWLAAAEPAEAEVPEMPEGEEVALEGEPAGEATSDWLSELVEAAGATMEEEPVETEMEEVTVELPDETAEAPSEQMVEAEMEADFLAQMEDLTPEEAFAAWEAMLAAEEGELEEEAVAAEPEMEFEAEAPEPPGVVVIEEPEKETLVYPEGAGGDVTESEAELFARLEEMSPEEAFAAWEAMLAADEEKPEEEAVAAEPEVEFEAEAPEPSGAVVIEEPEKETLVYPEGAGGEVTESEAELFARLEEMSPEEAFAAWEAMLAEGEVETAAEVAPEAMPEPTAYVEDEVEVPEMTAEPDREPVVDSEAELLAKLEDMSPEEAFAAWEAMLAASEEKELEEEPSTVEMAAEAEQAWMALAEDEEDEEVVTAEVGVAEFEEPLPEVVEEVSAVEPSSEAEQAWMALEEDEELELAESVFEDVGEVAPEPAEEELALEPVSEVEMEEAADLEAEEEEEALPAWAVAEAKEPAPEALVEEPEEVLVGPDFVVLSEEEEEQVAVAETRGAPVELEREEEKAEVPEPEFAEEEALVEIEAPARPTWEPLEEEPVADAAPAEPVIEEPAEEEVEIAEIEPTVELAEAEVSAEEPGGEEEAVEPEPVAEAEISVEKRVEKKEEIPEPEDDQGHLELARQLWKGGRKEPAYSEYDHLLKSALRDEMIADLEQITADEEAEEPIWRLLGDAYMRENRLEEALDAYRRALASL